MARKDSREVNEILEDIIRLNQEIAEKKAKIDNLKSRLHVQDEKPEPPGFDYKDVIKKIFSESTTPYLNIDDVVKKIFVTYSFQPNRNMVANRMNYLTDRDKKLERVEGKRGFYSLSGGVTRS